MALKKLKVLLKTMGILALKAVLICSTLSCKNLNRKIITGFLLMFFMLSNLTVYAQQNQITGTVKDEKNGETLLGVNIVIKGTTTGTVTDIDGNFSINVSGANDTLLISYIGYLDEVVPVGGRTKVDVQLAPDIKTMEEVVVVGYGTMKKSDITGAISSIKEDEIRQVVSNNVIEVLQGRVAGVDMSRKDGKAGSGFDVNIRGKRSLTASNDPIFIVDGVDFGSDVNINPNDIASMEVLKDAASTAIYGSRGSNGVVLITTKKGNQGKPVVAFNTYFGITNPLGKLAWCDREATIKMSRDLYRTKNPEYWDMTDEEMGDVFLADVSAISVAEAEGYLNGTDFDWYNETKDAYGTQQDYHLSITGGNEKTIYSLSLNNFIEDTYFKNDKFNRYSIRSNIQTKVSKFIEVGNSNFISYSEHDEGQGIHFDNPLIDPYDSVGNIKPYPNERGGSSENPLYVLDPELNADQTQQTNILSSFFAQLNIIEGLTFKSTINPNLEFKRQGKYKGVVEDILNLSTASVKQNFDFSYTWSNIANFNKSFGEHSFNIMAGTETFLSRKEIYFNSSTDLAQQEFMWYNLQASDLNQLQVDMDKDDEIPYEKKTQVSYIGRLHYGYKSKYLFTGTFRRDGASQLVQTWDNFPAASVAWAIGREDFMANVAAVSDLKVRVGYGVSGNSSVDPYSSLGGTQPYNMYYQFGRDEIDVFGFRTGRASTSPVWEKTSTLNIGLDFGLFRNRISGNIDIYKNKTKDILQKVKIAPTSAVPWVTENIGETEGKGVEISLKTINIATSDFNWTTNFTFSANEAIITYLKDGVQADEANEWFVGQPLDAFFDYKKIGIWQYGDTIESELYNCDRYGRDPGQIKFKDNNNDSLITPEDRMVLGSEAPKWIGSVSSTMTYKNFDFTIFVLARIGHFIEDDGDDLWNPDLRSASIDRNYWTPNNPTNDYPGLDPAVSRSGWTEKRSLMIKDGSYWKIKTITLGYSLPSSMLSKTKMMSSLRLYVSLKNYFAFGEFYKQGRFDPEGNGSLTPHPKIALIGANVTF